MSSERMLCSIYDGALSTPSSSRSTVISTDKLDERASMSSAPSSRSVSTASTSSADSMYPLMKEKQAFKVPLHVAAELAHRGFDVDGTGKVTWRSDSPAHPRNWSISRKTYDAAVVVFLEFFMTLVSNTGSSVAEASLHDLGVGREIALLCFTTTYLIGQAFGGLFLPPVAETFGGRTIYVVGAASFTIACILIAAAQTLPAIIIGRLVSGFASALPATVAVSSFENMFDARARIWVIHIWIVGAVSALGIGPSVATYISTSPLRWPWVFTISTAISGLATLLCLGMLESRPSQVLRQQIRAVRRSSGFDALSYESTDNVPNLATFCETSLLLPLRLFFTEPIVFFTSIMAATVSALLYLFPEAFTIVYAEGFGFSTRQCSLVTLSITVGVAFTFLPRLYDLRVSNRCRKNNIPAEPEDKIFGFLLAAPILAAAFWWFAFTVPPFSPTISPYASIASLTLVGFAVVEFDTVLSGYLTDTYTSYAASANASLSFLRAVLCGLFPVFGQRMFRALGTNEAIYLLAGVATAYCGVAVGFWRYGRKIRLKSRFARESWEVGRVVEAKGKEDGGV